MFKTIINAWKVKDIRTKMLYTLLLIVVYRLGSFIPVPSVNGEKLGELIASYDFLSFLSLPLQKPQLLNILLRRNDYRQRGGISALLGAGNAFRLYLVGLQCRSA